MSPNDADGMAKEQSDLGLHFLPRHICPKTSDHYGILISLIKKIIHSYQLKITFLFHTYIHILIFQLHKSINIIEG